MQDKIDGLVQDCTNSSVLTMELLQPCTEPSKSPIVYPEWPFSGHKAIQLSPKIIIHGKSH